jgi:hypothetical protein
MAESTGGEGPPEGQADTKWHALTPEDVLQHLQTSQAGLTTAGACVVVADCSGQRRGLQRVPGRISSSAERSSASDAACGVLLNLTTCV